MKRTHIIGVEGLAIGGILQQKPLKPKNMAYGFLRRRSEHVYLQLVHFVIPDGFLQDDIKLIKDLSPSIEIGSRPFPGVNVSQNVCKIIVWGVYELCDKLCYLRVLKTSRLLSDTNCFA
jgi:hypothetical protein